MASELPTSNHQCMWIRLPDVLHPLDTCPVRFYIPCIGELAHGAHAFYPDACPHCKKRVAVASSPVETTAFRGLKSISYRPDLPLVDLVMTFDSMEAAQAARERVTALVMRPVEPSEPRMPLEHYRTENGKLRKAMADLMHKCPRCRAEAKEALSAMTRKAHHPRCELMQPHGHEPPKCTCPSENGSAEPT